jgi:hypothetical protein
MHGSYILESRIIIVITILIICCFYGPCMALAFLLGFLIILDTWWDSFGRVISSSQRPLPTQDNTTYKHKDKHPWPERDSNSRSQQPSDEDLHLRYVFIKLWSTDHRWSARDFRRKGIAKIVSDTEQIKMHPYMSVLKLPLLVDLL